MTRLRSEVTGQVQPGGQGREVSRAQLRRYRDVISLWLSKYDTAEIARETKLPESLVAGWVANFRDMTVEVAA